MAPAKARFSSRTPANRGVFILRERIIADYSVVPAAGLRPGVAVFERRYADLPFGIRSRRLDASGNSGDCAHGCRQPGRGRFRCCEQPPRHAGRHELAPRRSWRHPADARSRGRQDLHRIPDDLHAFRSPLRTAFHRLALGRASVFVLVDGQRCGGSGCHRIRQPVDDRERQPDRFRPVPYRDDRRPVLCPQFPRRCGRWAWPTTR